MNITFLSLALFNLILLKLSELNLFELTKLTYIEF